MYRIMIVDDEQYILNALKRSLRSTNWEIETYSSCAEALRRAQVATFELFLSDYRMPEMNGVEFLFEIKQIQPESMRLILSGYTDLEALLGAINEAEIYRFITKPWEDYQLNSTIEQALHFRELCVENRRLADQVREQKNKLSEQEMILQKLEQDNPGITQVDWADDGSIIVSEKNALER